MDCREFLLRYSDYDDSLIGPDESARFRAHMAECASCARYDRVLRKGRMVARQLPRPEPDPDFIPRLQLRLRQDRHGWGPRVHRARAAAAARLAAGLAAATVLLVVSSAMVLDGPAPYPALVDAKAAEAVESWPAEASPVRPVRVVSLPAVDRVEPRAWPATEVAPAPTASYSPLETGPPAYRVASSTIPNPRRALD